MQSSVFEVFLAFLALSRIKWFKLCLCAMKLSMQHYLVDVIVLNLLESKTIVISLKLCAKLRFWSIFSAFGTFSQKVVQTWFVCHETWHITLRIFYCVEMVRNKNNSHMLKNTCKDAFLRYFSVFGTFVNKVVQ